MPLVRKSKIPAQNPLIELVALLQLSGALTNVTPPPWAIGAPLGEAMRDIKRLGDGKWLAPHYPGKSPQSAAETWLRSYFAGETVCAQEDFAPSGKIESPAVARGSAEHTNSPEDRDDGPLFADYLEKQSPAVQRRFADRLKSPPFAAAANAHIARLARALSLCALADDADYDQFDPLFTRKEYSNDQDLIDMSLFYFSNENVAEIFYIMRPYGCDSERAEARAAAIMKQLKSNQDGPELT